MMNWESILSTLWGKVSKPITNIMIGAVFLKFAPENVQWVGWIFLVIGIGNILDKSGYFFKREWVKWHKNKKIKEELQHLTKSEEGVLKLMVEHNKRIMRQTDFENYFSGVCVSLPSDIYDIFSSLDDKKIIIYSSGAFQGHFKITAYDKVWKILKKLYKEDFNIKNKKELKVSNSTPLENKKTKDK